jgi:hypothetical protein
MGKFNLIMGVCCIATGIVGIYTKDYLLASINIMIGIGNLIVYKPKCNCDV